MEDEDFGVDLHPQRHLTEAIARNNKVCEDILETVDTLRESTFSQNMEFYLVDHRTKEIYRCPREGYDSYKAQRHKIGSGSTIAAYVAELRQPMVCHDVVKVKNFPLGVDLLGSAAKRALCVPLISGKNDLIGVVELTRDKGCPRYTMLEFEMCINICNWMLPSIEDFFEEENILKENYAYSKLLGVLNKCICGHISHETFFAGLLRTIGNIMNSESYIFYTLYKTVMDGKPVKKAKMFVQADNTNYRRKLCFNVETVKTVAATAMLDRRIVTAVEKDFKRKYNSEIYKPWSVQSSICVPMILNGVVKGAIEYVNKMDCDRFFMGDRLLLASLSVFLEFNLFVGSLKNLSRKTKLLLIIDHEKLIRAMKITKRAQQRIESSKLTFLPNNRWEIPKDDSSALISIDRMLLEVVKIWDTVDHIKRLKFLNNILSISNLKSSVLWMKVWSSAEFVYDILKTYSPYFTDVEKELLMFSALFHILKSPNCGIHCLSTDIPITKTAIFHECNTFYFVRTLFKKSEMFTTSYFEPLMRKLKVCLHSLDKKELSGMKENMFKLLSQNKFNLNDSDHRIWLRYCILFLADQALYFRPLLLPLENSLKIAQGIEEGICKSDDPEDMIECDFRRKDVAKMLALHLRLNVFPMMILLRIILPETKKSLAHCLEAIHNYESFRIPRRQYVDYIDFIDEYFRDTD